MTRSIPFASLRTYLADQVELSGGVTAWARRHNFPKSVVSEVLSKKREMPDSIANSLGFVVHKIAIPMRGQNV